MPLNYLAIDFETANEQRGSVCAVGVAHVRNGEITASSTWYVQPPTGARFTNTHIHGIHPNDVFDAPTWAQSLASIEARAGGDPLVAYNSAFDKGVYNAASTLARIDAYQHVWRDALTLAKRHLDLPSYRLPHVVEHLQLDSFDHHDAGADAVAAAHVTNALARRAGVDNIDTLWPTVNLAQSYSASHAYKRVPETNPDSDPRHILHDVSITFSGELEGFTRDEARAAAAHFGANVTTAPTKKTDIVVTGGFDPASFRPGATISNKIQKAYDLRAAGQHIEIISEADFIAILNFDPDM